MSTSKRFLKSTIVFFIGNVSSKLILFLMIPLYSKMLSPNSFGEYDLGVTYANFFFSTLFCAVWMGTMRFMCDEKDPLLKKKAETNGNIIFGLLTFVYIIVFSVLNLLLKIRYFPLVLLFGLVSAMQMQASYVVRGYGRNTLFAVSGMINSGVTALSNIIFIAFLHIDYWALYVAAIIGMLVQIAFIFIGLKCKLKITSGQISKPLIKNIIKYCLPLCLNFSAMWFLLSYNRIVLVQVLGTEQNGYYAMAAKFNTIITLVGGCVGFAWQELSFNKGYVSKDDGAFYKEASNLYLKLIFWAQLLVIPAVFIVFDLVIDAKYSVSKSFVPFALLASVVGLFSGFLGDTFLAIKQSKIVFISMVVSAFISVVSMHLLVGKIGVQAASISMLFGHISNIILRSYFLKKLISVRLKRELIMYLLVSVPLLTFVLFVYSTQGMLMNSVVLLLFGFCFLWSFREQLRAILTKR